MARRYDEFEIEATIGVGTVGTIYRVVERATNQAFALKLLSPAVSSDDIVVARFEREMLILSKLNHPNIVTYWGDGKHEAQLFYVMELILGGTLKELLRSSGPLTWQETAECGRQIASALQHAHNHGIIHRDLKPGNIFFTRDGVPKLGDFGIARDLRENDLTDVGLTVGTYAYMAPELVRGKREITGQVDLYALGCTLYEMMTGQPPYEGDNFAAIFEQHLGTEPPHLRQRVPDCPPALDGLVCQLLAKSAEDRPFNARAVQGILGELLHRSDSALSTDRDRSAGSVRPIELRIQDRIRSRLSSTHDVSWRVVGVVGLTVVVAIVAMFLLRDYF